MFNAYKKDSVVDATKSVTLQIKVKGMYSWVSLISMIAPSPDWFVGVDSYNLCGSNGQWKDTATVNLLAWDAGTDHGYNFNSANNATMPPDVIKMITANSNTVIKDNANTPFGKFVFERQTSSSTAKPNSASTHNSAARAFVLLTVILVALRLLN